MPETTTPEKLTTAEINKFIKAIFKKQWPTWSSKNYSVKKDSHGNHHTDVTWFDHASIKQMERLLSLFKHTGGYFGPPTPFEYEGKHYITYTTISFHRVYSVELLKRIAVLFCRRHQIAMPEIRGTTSGARILKEENEPYVDGYLRSTAIMNYAASISEADLPELEKKTNEECPPLPGVDQEVQQQRDEAQEQREREGRAKADYTRQEYEYLIAVYSQIPGRESLVAELQGKAQTLAKRIRQLTIDLYDPVMCTKCYRYVEEDQTLKVVHPHYHTTRWICTACQDEGKTAFSPDKQTLIDEISELDQEEQAPEEQPYVPAMRENGFYEAKNGEAMPIITRDLLFDCRVSKYWLWFEQKPSREVIEALKAEKWQYGFGRKQNYHPNQFGILQIPPIIFEVYGGYIDGGFCNYRSTRGARLREYADKVEGKAEEMAEWSEQIVAKYMATGSIVTGGRRTRTLQKKKARAERKAAEARRLDDYAHALRERANDSERYQQRLASHRMLEGRLDTLRSSLRSYERDFNKRVDHTGFNLWYEGKSHHSPSVRHYVRNYFEYVVPHLEIIQEEIDIILTALEARKVGKVEEPAVPVPVAVPEAPIRSFSVEGVIEIYVGGKNYSELFPTHPAIADMILAEFPIAPDAKYILEPHGGTGSYLAQICHHTGKTPAEIHTYEWLYELNKHLTEKGYTVLGTDFLEAELPEEVKAQDGYDEVVMNPPFKDWDKQLARAFRLTRPGGRIRCTIPRGSEERARYVHLIRDRSDEYRTFDLPDDAFVQSGTNVRTSVLYFVKEKKVEAPPAPEPVKEESPVQQKEPVQPVARTNVPVFGTPIPPKKKEKENRTGFKQESLF